MTLQETAQIMDILTVAYPQFYNGKNAPDPQKALILWSSMFADDDAAVVAAAIKALIVSDPGNFPPSIGTVKAKVRPLHRSGPKEKLGRSLQRPFASWTGTTRKRHIGRSRTTSRDVSMTHLSWSIGQRRMKTRFRP